MGRILVGMVAVLCLGVVAEPPKFKDQAAVAGDHAQSQKGAPKRATASSADRVFNFKDESQWTSHSCTAEGCTYQNAEGDLFIDDHKGTVTSLSTGEVFKKVSGYEYRSQGKPALRKSLFGEMPKGGKPSSEPRGNPSAAAPEPTAALPPMLGIPHVKELAEADHPIGTVLAVKWSLRGCGPCDALEAKLKEVGARDPKFKHITLMIGATAAVPQAERERTPEEEINLRSAGKMWPHLKSYTAPMTYLYVKTADGWKTYGEGVDHSFSGAVATASIEKKIASQRAPLAGGQEIAVQPGRR